MKKLDNDNPCGNESLLEAEGLAVSFLSYKSRTEKEVFDKLCSYDKFLNSEITFVIERFKELGYINDLEYAEHFVRVKAQNKRDGTQKIKRMLLMKGIAPEIADNAISALSESDYNDGFDEADNAVILIKKKLGLKELDYDKKKRLFGYLQRKGYSTGVILEAFKRFGNEIDIDWE